MIDRMFNLEFVVKSIAGLGTISSIFLFLQAGVVNNTDFIKQISDLGAKGLLAAAVIILWKKLQEREDMILNLIKTLADALAANKVNIDKMSDILDDMKDSIEKMNNVRNAVNGK